MVIEDVISFLKKAPPFQFLDEKTLEDVARKVSIEYYPKGTVIIQQEGPPSEHLKIIKKGGVKVFMETEDKEEVLIDYRGESDNFGILSLISGDKARFSVVAIDDTVCYLIDKDTVFKLLDSSPAFNEYFLKFRFAKYIDSVHKELRDKGSFYGGSDRILFATRVGEIASKEVVTIAEEATILKAAQAMATSKISSIIVIDQKKSLVGIVTDRDLREKVVAKGRDLNEPVKNIMSFPLITVDAHEYCFEAVLKMIKHNIHHIIVLNKGNLDGIVTNHDLMLLQGTSPLAFSKDIENQQTIEGLSMISGKINKVIGLLLKEGAKASNITKIITELNDRLVKKALAITEKKLGSPPLNYCWIAYGSEGRKEQTFKTDQDNAIIYEDPKTEEESKRAEEYFSNFALEMRDNLVKCGFPFCPADFMASNPKWCQPFKVWKHYFFEWINNPTPQAILMSLIFFDFRPIFGDLTLAEKLRAYLNSLIKNQRLFLATMASVILQNRPPLGFFGNFVVEKSGEHRNELNMKTHGVVPVVDIARILALEMQLNETSTLDRLAELEGKHSIAIEYGEDLKDAYEFLMLLRLHHQYDRMKMNLEIDNFINPDKLSSLEKNTLRETFSLISKIQNFIGEYYMVRTLVRF